MAKQLERKKKPNEIQLDKGLSIVFGNDIFRNVAYPHVRVCGRDKMGKKTAALSDATGTIFVNKDISLSPQQWAYAIAHCALHNCFGHYDLDKVPGYEVEDFEGKKSKKAVFNRKIWNAACDIYVDKFLYDIKFGEPLSQTPVGIIPQGVMTDELRIYEYLIQGKWDEDDHIYGVGAIDSMDMVGLDKPLTYEKDRWGRDDYNHFSTEFAYYLAHSVRTAINKAADVDEIYLSKGKSAANWFLNNFPLLGALASSFKIIESYEICSDNDIKIAAVDAWRGEIYINPAARLSDLELKFVLAHEFLHVALMHHKRCEGRDPYLWNIATDYVINGWLYEMKIGCIPDGCLFDQRFMNMSAEEIYDIIMADIRMFMKMETLRGYGKGDILGNPLPGMKKPGVSLDEFYRNVLSQGLEYTEHSRVRGFIPAGLVEEIRALAVPPIPWDVKLAEWFNSHIRPLEKHRSYAHPSRRQSSTPDIPRPRYTFLESDNKSQTFGVVIDTSSSMSPSEIGKALGAIASYASAKDVLAVRVIFCDACAYDAGFMTPDEIAGRVKVIGRGGTMLQPGITLLQNAKDFPKDGPILIITDGEIEDHLDINREHAFILPQGCRLPFKARGEVFYM